MIKDIPCKVTQCRTIVLRKTVIAGVNIFTHEK
jgi:translation elongation factor P/translation initiation factor 5A